MRATPWPRRVVRHRRAKSLEGRRGIAARRDLSKSKDSQGQGRGQGRVRKGALSPLTRLAEWPLTECAVVWSY